MSLGVGMIRTELRLVPHHPGWAEFYRSEEERLTQAVGSIVLDIEHVGSTSVPELLAKPIVDIGMTVPSAQGFEPCIAPIVLLGYEYRGQYGPDPLRRYFVLEEGARRMVHLHVWTKDATAWTEAIRFRDLLRDDELLRRAYEDEKLRVAHEVDWDKQAYSSGKGPFIRDVLGAR